MAIRLKPEAYGKFDSKAEFGRIRTEFGDIQKIGSMNNPSCVEGEDWIDCFRIDRQTDEQHYSPSRSRSSSRKSSPPPGFSFPGKRSNSISPSFSFKSLDRSRSNSGSKRKLDINRSDS